MSKTEMDHMVSDLSRREILRPPVQIDVSDLWAPSVRSLRRCSNLWSCREEQWLLVDTTIDSTSVEKVLQPPKRQTQGRIKETPFD